MINTDESSELHTHHRHPEGVGQSITLDNQMRLEQQAESRFWDYVIGGALLITAVVLAIYTAPVWIIGVLVVIGLSFIFEGSPGLDGERRSVASQIWSSTESLSQNVANVVQKLSEVTKSPWFWMLLLAALAIWFYTDEDRRFNT